LDEKHLSAVNKVTPKKILPFSGRSRPVSMREVLERKPMPKAALFPDFGRRVSGFAPSYRGRPFRGAFNLELRR
jgi:hypothetical protein